MYSTRTQTHVLPAPSGFQRLINLAWPVVLGSLAQSVLYITDVLFVGRYGEEAVGAAGIGGMVFYLLTTIGYGFSVGFQVKLAEKIGAGLKREITPLFQSALWLIGGVGALFMLLLWLNYDWLAGLLVSDAGVRTLTASYLAYVAPGVFFGFLWYFFSGFFTGIERTRIILLGTVSMALINVLLNYMLVWGNFGFPELGIKGAALATGAAECVGFLVLLGGLWWRFPLKARLSEVLRLPSGQHLRKLSKFSLPIVFKQLMETGGWLIFFVFVERMGQEALATSNIIKSIYTFVSLPALALATALHTLISNMYASGEKQLVRPVVLQATVLSVCFTMLPGLLSFVDPAYTVGLFMNNSDLVPQYASTLKTILAVYFAFSICSICYNAVIGLGGIRWAFWGECMAIAAYLSVAYCCAFYFSTGLAGVWAAELVYWLLLGIWSVWYLQKKGI